MKILYWSGLFLPHIGGVEVLSLEFIPAMQKKGHEFVVITSRTNAKLSEKEEYKGTTIHRLPFHQGLDTNNIAHIKKTKQLLSEIKESFKPDLIHINSIDASIFFHLITNTSVNKVPTLFTVHSLPPYETGKDTLINELLRTADRVTTASEAMLASVRKYLNGNLRNSSLIYYGMKLPDIKPSPLSFESVRLLCIGRLAAEKGFDLALDSFSIVKTAFPEARLIIAGDGPERFNLESKAESLGLANSTEFMGWVPPGQVPEVINSSTLVIVPSRWEEPFGLAALQGAQMARPVVAANTGGLPEIVEHGKTGLLFEKNSSKDLAEQIMFLINDPQSAAVMGQNARRKAINVFGFDQFINSYDYLYKNIHREHKIKHNAEQSDN